MVISDSYLTLFSTTSSFWENRNLPKAPFGYPVLTAASMCISTEKMTGTPIMKCETANITPIANDPGLSRLFASYFAFHYYSKIDSPLILCTDAQRFISLCAQDLPVSHQGGRPFSFESTHLDSSPNRISLHKMSRATNLGNYQRHAPLYGILKAYTNTKLARAAKTHDM